MAVTLPPGASCAGAACGIKGGALDLGAIVFDDPIPWAGVFTANAAAAAPVHWCRDRRDLRARAVVVNSGNANACTGRAGDAAVRATADSAAASLGCNPDEILVASTGPIGMPLPVELVTGALPGLLSSTNASAEPFADAIMTTDTRRKRATATAGDATIVGIAKGAAMVAPNMATMLAFVVTDAALGSDQMHALLARSADHTFNRISIDACESTNDSAFLFATGAAGEVDLDVFGKALDDVCGSLAEQIVTDAEGASKLVRIVVDGAPSDEDAVELGRAVAASALWRAAAGGADPNWGRVLSAMGSVARDLDPYSVTVTIGEEKLYDRGEPVGSLAAAARAMQGDSFSVRCTVGTGPGAAQVLSSDLTAEYVQLNAEGTS